MPIGPDGWTTFGMIVTYGHFDWMKWAKQHHAFDPLVKADGGKSLIHATLPNPHKPFGLKGSHPEIRNEMIEFLVKNKVEINGLDMKDKSPLLEAAAIGDEPFFFVSSEPWRRP